MLKRQYVQRIANLLGVRSSELLTLNRVNHDVLELLYNRLKDLSDRDEEDSIEEIDSEDLNRKTNEFK